MKCPQCNVNLLMSDKQGVEIDYCPECRGIWLDRGELEKIIERSGQSYGDSYKNQGYKNDNHYEKHNNKFDGNYGHKDHKKRSKMSFLEDIFDFG